MKKFKYLFVLLIAILFVPFVVYADDEEVASETSNEVNVYFFRGEGCSHCAEAEAWFESIEAEYGNLYNIVDYETWYNEENAELMQKVAEARGEDAQGVPYIIIGDKSWNGYTESYSSEILEKIQSEYATDVNERYDIMKLLPEGSNTTKKAKKAKSNDVLALIVILVVVGGICTGVYFARSNTK